MWGSLLDHFLAPLLDQFLAPVWSPALPLAVMQLAGAADSSFENQVMQFGDLEPKNYALE